MKRLKTYKIFESNSIEDELRECFYPVIDIVYDEFASHKHGDKYASIFIGFPETNKDILIEEISDAILHCKGYNLDIVIADVTYATGKFAFQNIPELKLQIFTIAEEGEYNINNFEHFMKNMCQKIRGIKIIFQRNEMA
jgi:hypothetical protein